MNHSEGRTETDSGDQARKKEAEEEEGASERKDEDANHVSSGKGSRRDSEAAQQMEKGAKGAGEEEEAKKKKKKLWLQNGKTESKNGPKAFGGGTAPVRTSSEGCRKKMVSATPKSKLLDSYHDQLQQDGVQLPSKYEIISIREKHSQFRKAVPCMPLPVAILLCLLNLAAPGVGTLLSGLTILCGCRTEHDTRSKAVMYNVAAAILQLIMAPIIVGWVWSIMWGITFVNLSITKELQEPIPEAKI